METEQKLCDPPNCNEVAYKCSGCGAEGCYYKMRKACRCEDGPDEEPLYYQSDDHANPNDVRALPIGTKIISLVNENK